jgi:hypothetical protein
MFPNEEGFITDEELQEFREELLTVLKSVNENTISFTSEIFICPEIEE